MLFNLNLTDHFKRFNLNLIKGIFNIIIMDKICLANKRKTFTLHRFIVKAYFIGQSLPTEGS